MRTMWFAAIAVAAAPVVVAGDWKADVAKKAVGRAVRAGLEDAAKDAALAAALDVASDAIVQRSPTYVASRFRDIDDYVDIGAAVGDGAEAAMRVADVADTLDDIADAAKAVKKISRLRKLKR
jgi:hypothetical protein